MSTNKDAQKNKPVASRPFVVPDRKLLLQQQQQQQPKKQDTKPKYNNHDGKTNQYPKKDYTHNTNNGAGNKRNWWERSADAELPVVLKAEENQKWFTLLPSFVDEVDQKSSGSFKLQGDRLSAALKSIDAIFQKQTKMYNESLKTSVEMKSDLKWMNDMIKSGTMSDKVAAMALKVQGSPFHELETLDALVGMALKKEQRAAQLAMEALKDLFMNTLLPERSLRPLAQNLFNHPSMTATTAFVLWFEAQVAVRYAKVLDALDTGLKSNIDFFKRECLQTASELLCGKPEQEGRLLEMLVNKLGDPSRATCSKSIEVMKQVMKVHPAMKIVIVREVRQFLYRPNLKIRPIFNGIILLAQVQLNHGDHAVAVQLVEGYLSLFEKTMKEEEYGSRLLSALLTGINKALPHLKNADSLEKYVDPLFRIVHTATSFATATQALVLLSHIAISAGKEHNTDGAAGESQIMKRFYRALYAKLLSEQVLFQYFQFSFSCGSLT
jgi:ribosome biogenesis protein MAK21